MASKDNRGKPVAAKEGKSSARPKRTPREQDSNVGNALRSVYQQAVNEDIPAEFMDLLSKLS